MRPVQAVVGSFQRTESRRELSHREWPKKRAVLNDDGDITIQKLTTGGADGSAAVDGEFFCRQELFSRPFIIADAQFKNLISVGQVDSLNIERGLDGKKRKNAVIGNYKWG